MQELRDYTELRGELEADDANFVTDAAGREMQAGDVTHVTYVPL